MSSEHACVRAHDSASWRADLPIAVRTQAVNPLTGPQT